MAVRLCNTHHRMYLMRGPKVPFWMSRKEKETTAAKTIPRVENAEARKNSEVVGGTRKHLSVKSGFSISKHAIERTTLLNEITMKKTKNRNEILRHPRGIAMSNWKRGSREFSRRLMDDED